MAGITKEYPTDINLSTLEAEKAAAKARQERIFADAKRSVAIEAEEREQRYRAALARREMEIPVATPSVRDTRAIYVNHEEVIRNVFSQLQAETEDKKRGSHGSVEILWTDTGEMIYSIPDVIVEVQGDWEEAVFEYTEPDQVISKGDRLAVARGSTHLLAQFGRIHDGGYNVEMIDIEENPFTQLRLYGELRSNVHPDLGNRLGYLPNPDRFIHPSVTMQTEKNLSQLITIVQAGSIKSLN